MRATPTRARALLRLLRAGRFALLASVPLLLEYEAVLKRPEHLRVGGRTEAMTDAFLDALCLRSEPVQLFYLWRPRTRDPADDMVLETALNGRADHLVTLNQFFVTAIAEKVAALKTETYFRERRARGDLADLDAWLDASPDSPPEPGDELPE